MKQISSAYQVLSSQFGPIDSLCVYCTFLPYTERHLWIYDAACLTRSVIHLCRFQIQWSWLPWRWDLIELLPGESINGNQQGFFESLHLQSEFEEIINIPSSWWFSRGENILWIDHGLTRKLWRWRWTGQLSSGIGNLVEFKRQFRERISLATSVT